MYPKLKGKAADVRYLVPAVTWVWEQQVDRPDSHHRRIFLALKLNGRLDEIISEVIDEVLAEKKNLKNG